MNYMGSKNKIVSGFLPILQQAVDSCQTKAYFEPFLGGANVIDKITASVRVGADSNHYLIQLMRNLDKLEQLPDMLMREEYDRVRLAYKNSTDEFPDWYTAMVGFFASYNGRFFTGGFGAFSHTKEGIRNYFLERKKNMIQQREFLKDVIFLQCDYHELPIPRGCVVYCDPPYQDTKQYQEEFDSSEFWKWAETLSKNGADVYVSEESAPSNWKRVWSKDVTRTLDNRKREIHTECLFHL